MTTLSKEEKAQIIGSRLRNLEYAKYGFDVDALQENAKPSPSQEVLTSIQNSLSVVNLQITALEEELDKVNALTE